MDIRSVIQAVCALERSLVITDPLTLDIKRVWPYPLPASAAITDLPVWINDWSMTRFQGEMGGESDQQYAIHAQLFVGPATAEAHVTAEIASAFHTAFVTALAANPTLSGACHDAEPRGGDPTLVILERNRLPYLGLDEFVDVTLYLPV